MSGVLVRLLPWTVVLLLICCLSTAQEWSRFRGPNGSGVGTAADLPTKFGVSHHLSWKVDVPFGRSSPVLSKRHIFLTGSEEGQLVVIAVERSTGQQAWKRSIQPVRNPKMDNANDSATPPPVTDGRNLYVFFPNAGAFAFDPEGASLWHQDLGDYDSVYGLASSPILAGRILIVNSPNPGDTQMRVFRQRAGRRDPRHARRSQRPATGADPGETLQFRPQLTATAHFL